VFYEQAFSTCSLFPDFSHPQKVMNLTRILVVCTGNICRSPMGAALLSKDCAHLQISSAGLQGLDGCPAAPLAIEVMDEIGIDLSGHVARRITHVDAVKADVILVMETAQRRDLEHRFPEVRGRVFRFAEASGRDIPDPYRKSRSHFKTALKLMLEGANAWTSKLKPSTEARM
jgi:protein-tyrosine phosphatase